MTNEEWTETVVSDWQTVYGVSIPSVARDHLKAQIRAALDAACAAARAEEREALVAELDLRCKTMSESLTDYAIWAQLDSLREWLRARSGA